MTTHQQFLDAITESPNDLALRLMYGDWLEEQGNPLCHEWRKPRPARIPFGERVLDYRDDGDGQGDGYAESYAYHEGAGDGDGSGYGHWNEGKNHEVNGDGDGIGGLDYGDFEVDGDGEGTGFSDGQGGGYGDGRGDDCEADHRTGDGWAVYRWVAPRPNTLLSHVIFQGGGAIVSNNGDRREQIIREIKSRRGQSAFRRTLLEQYGQRCMISGNTIVEVLEAAHIAHYRGIEDSHFSNGLLLRSDLHTLFDLNLLGIHPHELSVEFRDVLTGSEYEQFRGMVIPTGPSEAALTLRWSEFIHG